MDAKGAIGSLCLIPTLDLRVPSLWDLLRDVRSRVGEHLKAADPDVRDAAVMAASELVENAIKYGVSGPDAPEPRIRIEERDGALEIRVSSGIRSAEAARSTIDRIELINRSADKMALYVNRLRELSEHPKRAGGPTQLGLYRVCGEGDFHLECQLEENVLHITATRRLA